MNKSRMPKLCSYIEKCELYNGKVEGLATPLFVTQNVFCKRGEKGWASCKRYELYSKNEEVAINVLPQ